MIIRSPPKRQRFLSPRGKEFCRCIPYSIAKKIVHKSSTIQQLYDIIGIRIIVEKEQECYDILGTIYKHYAYIPERYKNLIKFPRKNGYQSLHTVIINKDLRKIFVVVEVK